MLESLAPDLWVTERRKLRMVGVDLGTRMTVIRLRDGALFLHSPVALDPSLRKELEGIGTPRYAVAPNRFHHLFIGEYAEAYPALEVHVAPGLETKRKDLRIEGVLADAPPTGWSGQIE